MASVSSDISLCYGRCIQTMRPWINGAGRANCGQNEKNLEFQGMKMLWNDHPEFWFQLLRRIHFDAIISNQT